MATTFQIRQQVSTVKQSWLEVIESSEFEHSLHQTYQALVVKYPDSYFEFVKVESNESCISFTPKFPIPEPLDLAARMKAAGMMSIESMLATSPMFSAHAGVTDLNKFEEWLQMKREEYLKQQALMMLDKKEEDEMFEWVLSHSSVLGEVVANFRQATGRNP